MPFTLFDIIDRGHWLSSAIDVLLQKVSAPTMDNEALIMFLVFVTPCCQACQMKLPRQVPTPQ
jgi:hypothetical protein